MVIVGCTIPNCGIETADVSENLAIALLANHGLAHQSPAHPHAASTPLLRGPKLNRPKVNIGLSIEDWNVFFRRWEVFRTGSGIDEASAPSQLFQCAGTELGDSLLKGNPQAISDTLPQLLAAMRSLAVIPVATCGLRTELLQLRQERDEAFRAFTARVGGKAETCAFDAQCVCGQSVDYTDHVIRDVLLNGLSDPDIRRDILGTLDILHKSMNDVVALVENKEMARNALPSSSLSAVSMFQRNQHRPIPPPASVAPPKADRDRVATCPACKTFFQTFTEGARGWNTKPHQVCISCYRVHRRKGRQQHSPQAPPPNVQASIESDAISQVAAFQTSASRLPTARLDHQIFTKGEWKRARLLDHLRIPITISVDQSTKPSHPTPGSAIHVDVSAIADTGAQSDLWSLADFLACGFLRSDLHPISLSLSAANRSPISIEGAFFA